MRRIEVKLTEGGKWGLFIEDVLIGESKHRFDADHAAAVIQKLFQPTKEEQNETADGFGESASSVSIDRHEANEASDPV